MITEEQIQAVVRRIVEGYAPDKIILFGAYAYGVPHENSDLDFSLSKRRRRLSERSEQWLFGVICGTMTFPQWIF